MASRGEYRIASMSGAFITTVLAVLFANTPPVQSFVTTYVPLAWRLEETVLSGQSLAFTLGVCTAVVFFCLLPLYKPQPRRSLDIIIFTQKRVLTAMFAIATLGYFNWSYRLPRPTLGITMGLLLVLLPVWFVVLQNRLAASDGPALIIGTDPDRIEQVFSAANLPIVGYLAPPVLAQSSDRERVPMADGGGLLPGVSEIERLGGLSRLEDTLLQYDIKTVFLAFSEADRGEFFGALATCHKHGVQVKVPRDHKESVLLASESDGKLITVDLEPWDCQDQLLKRLFDLTFAGVGLLVLAPLIVIIAVAIKLDSRGPVFYTQKRTAGLGGTFQIRKFRSMATDAEKQGAVLSSEDAGDIDSRVTRVGRILRKTHMDEIPQLWSIITGKMSVVGPRPERPELDSGIQEDGIRWEKRWFVKPGLTGLAQINDVTGFEPEEKLEWDLQYIQQQSFWFDLKIVLRQIWTVIADTYELVRGTAESER